MADVEASKKAAVSAIIARPGADLPGPMREVELSCSRASGNNIKVEVRSLHDEIELRCTTAINMVCASEVDWPHGGR